MSHSAELSFQILRYACQRLAEGDINALLDLGFLVDEIQSLEKLTLRELDHLSRLGAHFLDVRVDHLCFTASLRHVRREADSESLQDELIRMKAPAAMMQTLFGMTTLQYANRRKLLGLAGIGVGRPPAPSEAENHTIWYAWRDHASLPEAQRYLETGRTTGMPLNVVWALVQSWEDSAIPHRQDANQAISDDPDEALALSRRSSMG